MTALEDEPEVLECHHVTGEDAFYLRLAVGSMERLEKIVQTLSAFGTISTALILSTPHKINLPLIQNISS
ncbi:MAG: Lrp/AsnC ligand binding domain-containing protein [Anaerolineales bacterium]|nr:Lrp/AsnC ligand binding domain-containing protein [Anaerolineales bacterium]